MTNINDAKILADYDDPTSLYRRFKPFREWNAGQDLYTRILDHTNMPITSSVLDYGCGDGSFLEAARTRCDYIMGVDQSPAMVDLTNARGIFATDPDWPVDYGEIFDYVYANWMLYHFPDIHVGLSNIKRLLAPDGTFVAVTFGAGMMREVWDLVGGEDLVLTFNAENGKSILQQHYQHVESIPIHSECLFPDRDSIVEYISSTLTRSGLVDKLPEDIGSLRATTTNHLFIARN